eukprot:GHVL01036415.1.p1 GENE.GHVL01036415.1~~GHVL01036415.1.p1  ORF type:complete len:852 (+),score=135.32 GHVL01036415.1:468-3023(+)
MQSGVSDSCITHAMDIRAASSKSDFLQFELVEVDSWEEAVVAILFNWDIQAVVVESGLPALSQSHVDYSFLVPGGQEFVKKFKRRFLNGEWKRPAWEALVTSIKEIRPELDVYVLSDRAFSIARPHELGINRVFCTSDDKGELYMAILQGIKARAQTPFFDALVEYSRRPIGVFHALAISRGGSLLKSRWIGDFIGFYGRNLFLAESSSTCGGLDSLLDPHGAIRAAQQKAAKAFGAEHTFFVTNGTSTANKIVHQAILKPGDIVLIDRDCHKSHHYGLVLTGAQPCYLDAYPLDEYSIYGGVPTAAVKRQLLVYHRMGQLHRVKMIVLTNCTFDGIVYNVQALMEQALAIKPDLVFLWDEAWFAFATFNHVFRCRTGIGAANKLQAYCKHPDASKRYRRQLDDLNVSNLLDADSELLIKRRLVFNPVNTRIRVYVCQSTHKSLTALRQGSMIHVRDDLFRSVEVAFHEAYYTHTSTSPNYQILASLDVGVAQLQLEGYQFVREQIEWAMQVRKHVADEKMTSKYFKILDVEDLIPGEYRNSGIHKYYDPETACFSNFTEAWFSEDEFALDPSRMTLHCGRAGLNGNDFKVHWLMDKFSIQVNKTSRNSVLLMTNIGTTESAISYLHQSLDAAAAKIDADIRFYTEQEQKLHYETVAVLTSNPPPLPNFSRFHDCFRQSEGPEGMIRDAFYAASDEANVTYYSVNEIKDLLSKKLNLEDELVATTFIIPYPPGFPILVPGQVITACSIDFLTHLDVKEIHGLNASHGLRVFKKSMIEEQILTRRIECAIRQQMKSQKSLSRTPVVSIVAATSGQNPAQSTRTYDEKPDIDLKSLELKLNTGNESSDDGSEA